MAVAVEKAPKPQIEAVAPLEPPTYRFSVKQYHRMIEAGILTGDDRVELLEGWIVQKMPHNPPHDSCITRINRRLICILSDDWLLRVQSAITLKDSEPEPDLAIVPGPEEIYFTRHPVVPDIATLIEVADSALEDDRSIKGRLYARARIGIYWIVNLVDRQIEVYTHPKAGKSPAYRQRQDYAIEQAVPLIIDGREIARISVSELLP
jgi:hypothetical protein